MISNVFIIERESVRVIDRAKTSLLNASVNNPTVASNNF